MGIPWRRAVGIVGVDDGGILESDPLDENSNVFSRSVWRMFFPARTRGVVVDIPKSYKNRLSYTFLE